MHEEDVISHIIIDGYNVIGIFHKDIQKARDVFVEMLINYSNIRKHDITVVFDGYKSGAGIEHAAVRGGINIIYSRLGDRADDVIKRIISEKRMEWIVVSSDRDIANHAWTMNSIPVPSERFFETISRHLESEKYLEEKNNFSNSVEKEDIPDYDSSENFHHHKGNPHKPSRKEKALRRALVKL